MTNDGTDHDGGLPTDGAAAEKRSGWFSATQLAGLASLGAGAIHAAAIGIHAEHATLARLFVAVAAAQLAAGLVMLVKGGRLAAAGTALVNAGAVAAWAVTRVAGISWIEGLEQSEAPQFADTACAALGAVAAAAAVVALVRGQTRPAAARLGVPAVAVGALTVVAMMYGGTHVHSHDDGHATTAAGAEHTHGDEAAATDGHAHTDDAADRRRRRHRRPRPHRRCRRQRRAPRAQPTATPTPTTPPPPMDTPIPMTPRACRRRCGRGHGTRASRSTSPACPA